jgi:hypothetical protein
MLTHVAKQREVAIGKNSNLSQKMTIFKHIRIQTLLRIFAYSPVSVRWSRKGNEKTRQAGRRPGSLA